MSCLSTHELPKLFELVVGTVKKIEDHGAFITLDEYGGLEAYIPFNEVSHSWFKNIREVLKIGQKKVFKVIRIDPKRKHVDVSLKRVAENERRAKLQEWKRSQRAAKLLELAARKLGGSLSEATREAEKLEKTYGEIFTGFEAAVREGRKALEKAGVKEPWLSTFLELAENYVRVPKVKVRCIFTVRCSKGDGVNRLRAILTAWKEVKEKHPEIKARFYVEGSPKYRLEAEAFDPKHLENFINELEKILLQKALEEGCQASFEKQRD
ncbi:MAG: translation initiation factor IF-2 subunit alpha [Thermofilaceae archaeon]